MGNGPARLGQATHVRARERARHPCTENLTVDSTEDLERAEVELPAALKPAIKEHFIYVTKVKALRADTRAELDSAFRQTTTVIPPSEIMVQELIPGDGETQFSYCTFFKDGEPLAKMVVRRARQRPTLFGRSSTYVETVDMPQLEEPSERFLRAINYYGLAEMEYKFDERDGRYKLLDVNLRTWGSHTIGWPAGVDFAYLLFRDQLGQPVEPVRARVGVRWIRMATDSPHLSARSPAVGSTGACS